MQLNCEQEGYGIGFLNDPTTTNKNDLLNVIYPKVIAKVKHFFAYFSVCGFLTIYHLQCNLKVKAVFH